MAEVIVESTGIVGPTGAHLLKITGEDKDDPRVWASVIEQAGGTYEQRRAAGWVTAADVSWERGGRAEWQRFEEGKRIALQKQIEESNRRARAVEEAREQATRERQQAIQERQLQQEATRRGRSIQQLKEEKVEERAEELKAISKAEEIRVEGKPLTRRQYLKAIGGAKGLVALRRGTKAEKEYFRKTGTSLEEERRKERQAQQQDPLKSILSVSDSLEPTSLWRETSSGMEEWARERITYPIAERVSDLGITAERYGLIAGGTAPTLVTPGLTILPSKKERAFQIERSKGQVLELKERPVKTALTAAVFFALPPVLSGAGKVVAPIARALPTTAKVAGTIVKVGLPIAYVGTAGYRILSEPTIEERGERLGRIETGEILPMTLGGYAGAKVWPKVSGWLATRGRTEVATEKLVPKDVLYGKKRFPEAPSKEHLRLFIKESKRLPGIKEPIMYHQAGARFWKGSFVAEPGTSEFKGLYGSYGVSPHFLRVQRETKIYGGELFKPYTKPGTLAIIPKRFVVGKAAPKGTAFIPGVKLEVEAILPPETTGKIISKELFYKWKGVRIPIDVARVSGIEKGAVTTVQSISGLASSYGGLPRTYLSTPSSLALSSYLGIRPSYKPSKPSRVSKISKSITSEISEIIGTPYRYPISRRRVSKRISRKVSKPYSYKSMISGLSSEISRVSEPLRIMPPVTEEPTPFLFKVRPGKRKPKKVKEPFEDVILYTPGFLSRVLGIKKRLTRKQMLKKLELGALGLREIPILEEPIKIKRRREIPIIK